jgi:1-acyl-sn-glycerol-3-phosphate acyltransferase
MLYAAVRPIARIALRQYFRRIDIAHLDRIPKDAPVILAANHPTAFIEPCIMACFSGRSLHFLVRGNLFRKAIYDRMLRSLHMLPVFRFMDGTYDDIRQNYATFAACHEALAQHKVIMILAEGRCIHEKRLRPIRKGTARIAFGAIETQDNVDEVYIVPVGVNYTYAERVRSEVMITCGEPIQASKYWEAFQTNPQQTTRQLTQEIRHRLEEDVIIIEAAEDEPLADHLFRLYRTEHPRAPYGITANDTFLRGEKKIADAVNAMAVDPKARLAALASSYFSRLAMLRLDDAALANQYRSAQGHTRRVALGILPALVVGVLNLFPLAMAQLIAGPLVKTVEFESSVRWGAAIGGYFLLTLIALIVSLATGAWWVLLFPLLAILSLPWWLRYLEMTRTWLQAYRVRRQTTTDLQLLRKQRSALIESLKGMLEEEEE